MRTEFLEMTRDELWEFIKKELEDGMMAEVEFGEEDGDEQDRTGT